MTTESELSAQEKPLPQTVTRMLSEWHDGQDEALERLIPLIYDKLHRIAHHYLRREKNGHILQTTALINEAWLRLAKYDGGYNDRAHFYAVAAQVMRRLLVDLAQQRNRQLDGGARQAITLDESLLGDAGQSIEVLALHEALESLAKFDARKGQIVELRYFGGLNHAEIAQVLGLAEITVKKEWGKAKVWLHALLSEEQSH